MTNKIKDTQFIKGNKYSILLIANDKAFEYGYKHTQYKNATFKRYEKEEGKNVLLAIFETKDQPQHEQCIDCETIGKNVFVFQQASDEVKLLKEQLRNAIADYMVSEGCSCCRSNNHSINAERIAKLIDVPPYDGEDGYQFYAFKTEPKKNQSKKKIMENNTCNDSKCAEMLAKLNKTKVALKECENKLRKATETLYVVWNNNCFPEKSQIGIMVTSTLSFISPDYFKKLGGARFDGYRLIRI